MKKNTTLNPSLLKGWVTVNTDAGYYKFDRVGSFAYWIKYEGKKLCGSGMLKEQMNSSTEAENMAIINALYILKKSGFAPIKKIIINRDCTRAISRKKGTRLEKITYELLREIFDAHHGKQKRYQFSAFYEFRWVKAHQDAGKDNRTWVNNWLDLQCKFQLQIWRKQQDALKQQKTA